MGAVEHARECHARRDWRHACDAFQACEPELDADDLERLAVSAYLVGENAQSDAAWSRAHQIRLDGDAIGGAVRCAFWIAFRLVNAFDGPGGNGWIARLERLLADGPVAPLDQARLAYLTGLRAVFEGDLATGEADLNRSATLAWRGHDAELTALARLSLGRVLIFQGELTGGVRLLDEAMLAVGSNAFSPIAVGSNAFSPIAVGDSYCTAIEACHDLVDVRRGQVWTDGLTDWCARQTDMVPFAGVCQVHRAEFLQLKGSWVEAMAQAGLARARLAEPFRQLAYGAAVYQQGELHRLRGDFDLAEACYREASASGRDPQPGLALLRLSQDRVADAALAIDRALNESADPVGRAHLLEAFVEIMLASDRLPESREAAAELAGIAATLGSPMLDGASRRTTGAVCLAEGDARAALAALRRAGDGFRELDAPYETARTAVLIARARLELGDEEGARLERDSARETFQRLGARPDVALLDGPASSPLTARELQVLRLVAQGSTNRSIGAELGLSERTVDRHVSNIFSKLGVSSRTAATALAYESEFL